MLRKQEKRVRRHKRIRAEIFGTKERPRLCIFRSNKYIYGQLIDDQIGKTLAAARGKIKDALQVGKLVAKKAKDLKIEKVVFDRGGYSYHGKIKSLAEAAREGGLKF